MRSVRRILVAVKDPFSRSLPAVAKAAQLAQAFGAGLELFHGLTVPVYVGGLAAPDRSPARIIAHERSRSLRRLETMARRIGRTGIAVTAAVEADFPAYEAIIRRASRTRADLIVADCHAGRHAVPWLLQLTDWELLRHSALPVLLVRSRRPYRRPVILAAVDPLHANAKPGQLDREILVAGASLKDALHGTLHAVHGCSPMPAGVAAAGLLSPQITIELLEKAEYAAGAAFDRLLRHSGIPQSRRHLVNREAFDAIRGTARAIRAEIVVMGAISRSGFRRLVIGNTAERLLDELACDALIVKPRGFKTHVARARRGARLVGTPMPFPY